MKNYKLIISDQAASDLQEIWLYIAQDNPTSADKFIKNLYDKCRLLSERPNLGRKRDELIPGLKSLIFQNYIVFYRIKGLQLEIIRILNGYRDIDSLF